MILKAISFSPLRYELNGAEVPVVEVSYQDENDKSQKVSYVMIDGEKFAIHNKADIMKDLTTESLDVVLAKVEEKRQENLKPKEEIKP